MRKQRKELSVFAKGLDALRKYQPSGSNIGSLIPVPATVTPAEDSFASQQRLVAELLKYDRAKDAVAFCTLLQCWLHFNGIEWPKGVFRFDLNAPRGRPRKYDDAHLRLERVFNPKKGAGALSKELHPELAVEDPQRAKQRAKQALRNARPTKQDLEAETTDDEELLRLTYSIIYGRDYCSNTEPDELDSEN